MQFTIKERRKVFEKHGISYDRSQPFSFQELMHKEMSNPEYPNKVCGVRNKIYNRYLLGYSSKVKEVPVDPRNWPQKVRSVKSPQSSTSSRRYIPECESYNLLKQSGYCCNHEDELSPKKELNFNLTQKFELRKRSLALEKGTCPLSKWQIFCNMASLFARRDRTTIKRILASESKGNEAIFNELLLIMKKKNRIIK